MIINCESCSKKFLINDQEIPKEGRMVQCGNCSVIWHQMPALELATTKAQSKSVPPSVKNIENLSTQEVKASDGKTYKFLGNQWAQLLPSGKTGLFAKKKISKELDKITGKKTENNSIQKSKKRKKDLNPSEVLNNEKKLPDIYKPKSGLGFLGYVFIMIIISFSAIGIIKTFQHDWLNYFPQDQYIFDLFDEQLIFVAESVKNIIVLVKDLINSY